ncbi:LysM peptidoglycan-binding domain-containing protein [Patescibacteria group bacterium]|nr:LysM peptidoglycan-binding domain-containing protein [Patescibacteria group bacterium]
MSWKIFVWAFLALAVLAMIFAPQPVGTQVVSGGEPFSIPGVLVWVVVLVPVVAILMPVFKKTGVKIPGKAWPYLISLVVILVGFTWVNSQVKNLDQAAASGGFTSSISATRPVAVQAAVQAPQGSQYTVVAGNTLWGICRNHYGSSVTAQLVTEVSRVNGLTNGGANLQVGQQLTLP